MRKVTKFNVNGSDVDWQTGGALASIEKAAAGHLQPRVALLECRPLVTDPLLMLLFDRQKLEIKIFM